MGKVLKVNNVRKTYDGALNPSLDDVSFSVDEGEFLCIMGPSGSGKTTLLNVISTIDTKFDGQILIGEKDLRQMNNKKVTLFRKDYIGYIFQEYFLLDSLTLRENILVPLALKKYPKLKMEKEVKTIAERFGIDNQLDKYPCEVSGGQRQRASAARAIIKNPKILFADEPTGALDSASSVELLSTLKRVNEDMQTTIIMVTHDAYAASYADRIIVLKDGKLQKELVSNGDRKEFYNRIMDEIMVMDLAR